MSPAQSTPSLDSAPPESLAEQTIVSLQRSAGNTAVAALLARSVDSRSAPEPRRTALLQRAIRIARVDFNPDTAAALEATLQPVDEAFTNWDVDPAQLRTQLLPYLRQNAPAPYPAGNAPIAVDQVRGEIRGRLTQLNNQVDIEGNDVPDLSAKLATHLRGTTALTEGEHERLRTAIQAALGSASFELEQPAGGLFDQLVANAGGGSRAKGAPTQIQHGQLPGPLQQPVASVITQIRTRNQALFDRATTVMQEAPGPTERLSLAATEGMAFVRTVHTNESGWLPPVDPPDEVRTFDAQLLADVPGKVRKGLVKHEKTSTAFHSRQYARALAAKLQPLGVGRDLAKLCWGSYSLHTGRQPYPYVEFSIGHPQLSRLIYDYVNGRFFISFHYHWHKGFNPFFHVQGLADL